jgi:hypothetical protein
MKVGSDLMISIDGGVWESVFLVLRFELTFAN